MPRIKSPAHAAFQIGIFFKGLDGVGVIVIALTWMEYGRLKREASSRATSSVLL